ncbi:trypsin-like serine peptidase [Lentzea sp. JNUCC 0626]|uniref:trypsin-like serine peptidase n=1 Tax=Lentzea sp. JNUCC 0626 TaxID=3367513 RepID=UPI00374992B6
MRILSVVALLLLGVPGVAAASPPDPDVIVHDLDTAGVADYWTPERIAAMPTGPSAPPGTPPVDDPTGAPAENKAIGRLFFVDRDGEDSSCTATLVVSANKRTAVTGGHCVHTANLAGFDPKWHSKMLFVPGFRDGARPFGQFVVRRAIVNKTWIADDQQSEFDQAFIVLDRPAGTAEQIAFDRPGDRFAREYGYPRAANKPGHQGRPEFTGQRLAQCWGKAVRNPGHPEFPEENMWGVPCDMGGGSSGGPRISGNAVVGVNIQSFNQNSDGQWCPIGECVRHLGGAQFTAKVTRPLYQRAQFS